jgi:hypothetical protein
MVRGDEEVERAATCVFPSVRIVDGLESRIRAGRPEVTRLRVAHSGNRGR